MRIPPEMATRTSALLLAVAAGRADAAQAFQSELYPVLLLAARKRTKHFSTARLGTDGLLIPPVAISDRDALAHDVTVHTLRHLVTNAARFDPDAGDGLSWALRQLTFSHVDVVRDFYQIRRTMTVVPTSPEQLVLVADERRAATDPAAIVRARAALEAALDALTPDERRVTLALMHWGYTYAETAAIVFGDASKTNEVDRLIRSARGKLRLAEQRWNGTSVVDEGVTGGT